MTAPTLPFVEDLEPVQNLSNSITDRTVCIVVTIYGIGNSKKVPIARAEKITGETTNPDSQIDRTLLSMSKQLLDSPELRAIRKFDGGIRSYLKDVCLPYRVGIHLLPNELIPKTEEEMKKFAEQRLLLVAAFLQKYPDQIKVAEQRLKTLYNELDYKPSQFVRDAFTFEWQYLNFGVPGKLKDIGPAFFQAEQEKHAQKWQEASEVIEQVLRAQMADFVDKLRDRLTPNPDGKPKVFHASTVENLQSFLDTFDVRNVTNDDELATLVKSARAMMANISADDLRSNEAIRDGMVAGFDKIKEQLDVLVIEGAGRSISFEEE